MLHSDLFTVPRKERLVGFYGDRPAEEAQLQHMQQPGELDLVPEQHRSSSALTAEVGKFPVILQPEPAEHLDQDRRQNHEADQHTEPEEVPPGVELGGDPHVRAPVHEKSEDTDHREDEVDPGIVGDGGRTHNSH